VTHLQKNQSSATGFWIVGLLAVLAIIAILLAVTVPMLTSAHINALEAVAIREVQTIHQAEMQYYSQFGEYAGALSQLGPPENGIVGPQAAKLLPASLSSGEKNGYIFSLTKTPAGYVVHANPKVSGKNGWRTFYIDEDGTVHQNWGPEPVNVNSPEIK
jgi:type II secretory pathway pseudopilin PulG